MFSTFRDKFKAVQNDVILGFQRLTGPDVPTPGKDVEDDIASLAGARLLSHYQSQWSKLHTNAEKTFKAADALNVNICAIRDRCQKEHEHVTEFHRRLTALPEISAKVHSMVATVASLQSEFASVELQLVELEHEAELARLEDRKMRERARLAAYRRAREQHFEELQITVAQEHLERASQRERRQRSEQAERYAAFDQMAHQELEHFRQHKSLDVVRPILSQTGPQLTLEEVDIRREDDATALAEFLADTELDPQDPAGEMDSNPEDPARGTESDPEDPARGTDLDAEDPAKNVRLCSEETSPKPNKPS